jgi:1,4-alpha-glucan branching enzyme
MNELKKIAVGCFLLLGAALQAQVSLQPAFATQNDTVTILYDASLGNAGLVGVNQVYIHTGVITNLSTSATDWRNVQGNWGTDDPNVKMTPLGNDMHSIRIHIPTFYGLASGETVSDLAMVFRNQDGSKEGKSSNNGDIYVPIYNAGLQAAINQPSGALGIYSLNDTIYISSGASQNAQLSLYHENTLLKQESNALSLDFKLYTGDYGAGKFNIRLEATQGATTLYDTIRYLARANTNIAADPRSAEEGITVIDQNTLFFKLRAPGKDLVYLIGDFNDWELEPAYDMNQTPDGEFFWLEVNNLDPNTEYRLQYYVGSEGIRIADPYSEKILDPWNDQWIPSTSYPNLIEYPTGKTDFPVTAFKINEAEYVWDSSYTYERVAEEELLIYELLIRDFDTRRTYQSVIDRLSYFDSLGINAIELMPVMEFEGNESWGYNPMFFMAPDKYYGTKNDFKALVDSCHKHGIAIILDIALNHAFGQSPLVRMYFENGAPTANSPYFNTTARHDFNVGYDFNHEAPATIYHTRRVFQHWLEEYKVDGYRVDLSKGFTQRNTLGNVGLWGQYDQSRVDILNRIKSDVEQVDPDVIMILEHFADNPEERALAEDGFLLWGNENHQYNEATMAYQSDFSSVYHENRNFDRPALVGFMESHDEERLVYRNINFGNTSADYNTKELDTALDRAAQAAVFFFTIPGPKMMWQFGEMGYDYSINWCTNGTIDPSCRVGNKPVRWDYYNNPNRRKLNQVYSKLMRLRNDFPQLMQTDSLSLSLGTVNKTVHLYGGDSNLVAVGNFGISSRSASINLPHAGSWYDYFSGDSLYLEQAIFATDLQAGEYVLLTDFKTTIEEEDSVFIPVPSIPLDSTTSGSLIKFFPNPNTGKVRAFIELESDTDVKINMFNPVGQLVYSQRFNNQSAGLNLLDLGDLKQKYAIDSGLFYYQVITRNKRASGSILIL